MTNDSQREGLVSVEGLGKRFCRDLKRSLWYGVCDIAAQFRPGSQVRTSLRTCEFRALDQVSFTIRRGECLGVIGANGAGKSTLLKVLSGLIKPDAGRVRMCGRVNALIELGAGFHPLLTGRENIYTNAAILGITREEMASRFDKIVEFAGIAEFLDTPVRHYSSGMYVRLGFAVAIHCSPDILLVDEVLAVGDIRFQNRSYDRIMEMRKRCGVVVVSHNLGSISVLCDRVLWLDRGKPRMLGATQEVVSAYLEKAMGAEQQLTVSSGAAGTFSGDIVVEGVEVLGGETEEAGRALYGEPLTVRCRYRALRGLGKVFFRFDIRSAKGIGVFGACMKADGVERRAAKPGPGSIECRFESIPLQPGSYTVGINIIPENGLGKLYRNPSSATFSVAPSATVNAWSGKWAAVRSLNAGPVFVPYRWRYGGGEDVA